MIYTCVFHEFVEVSFFWVETLEFHSWIRGPSRLIAEFSLNFLRWRLGWRSAHGGLGLWRVVRVKGRGCNELIGGLNIHLAEKKWKRPENPWLDLWGIHLKPWMIFFYPSGFEHEDSLSCSNLGGRFPLDWHGKHVHAYPSTRLVSYKDGFKGIDGLTFSWKAFHRSDVFFLENISMKFINGGFHHVSSSHAPT